ncbi:MAG: DUF2914 domain-containing protein [Bdellovibrionaceae bacterium]|nr:DUF2914 domain-containing protein [Pseudobdellovibrionaceae bacterium]
MGSLTNRLKNYYNENETRINIGFFFFGVLVDIFTVSDIDNPLTVAQQVIYLFTIGLLLYYDFLSRQDGGIQVRRMFSKIWDYRDVFLHFFMGGLLSIYSIFFIKSASIFSSFAFIIFMVSLMVINELKFFRKNKVNFKIGLYLICVFSFFSMIFPVLLGFVGWQPFALSLVATLLFLWALYRMLLRRVNNGKALRNALILPGVAVLSLFGLFYYLGWIPPVPLSTQEIGIYHDVQKVEGDYILKHQTPTWMFWRKGDQHFVAQEGDKIYVFVRVFSPARFSDSVILHWQLYNDSKQQWTTTDRIPMSIRGGRKGGYRGYASKQNYQEGEYRVLIETQDGREIGRLGFWVSLAEYPDENRTFFTATR